MLLLAVFNDMPALRALCVVNRLEAHVVDLLRVDAQTQEDLHHLAVVWQPSTGHLDESFWGRNTKQYRFYSHAT